MWVCFFVVVIKGLSYPQVSVMKKHSSVHSLSLFWCEISGSQGKQQQIRKTWFCTHFPMFYWGVALESLHSNQMTLQFPWYKHLGSPSVIQNTCSNFLTVQIRFCLDEKKSNSFYNIPLLRCLQNSSAMHAITSILFRLLLETECFQDKRTTRKTHS